MGVPQGTILGPLFFNIYLADLFLEIIDIDIANYAGDNAPYFTAGKIDGVMASLENTSNSLFKWFSDTNFKGNTGKCHILVHVKDGVSIKIGEFEIAGSECEKLLGVKFDYKLTFTSHVSDLRENASRKINGLASVAPYISILKQHILMDGFVTD